MPKRLIKKIKSYFAGKGSAPAAPRLIPASQHSFPASDVSQGARRVLETLVGAGFEAYLVGGSIRDGLLGAHPKDFDITTSAHPEEIKQLFRSCRLIGRRFRLAHVRVGREILEVATFRGHHELVDPEQPTGRASVSDEGLILRDNVFGTVQEDAIRRDFTANALFYRHTDGVIIDYVGGFDDIQARRLRLIGDPETRFREDPVRMLRAIRFAAKLDFEIEPATAAPMRTLGQLLEHVPAARLFEEMQKLLLSGYASAVWTKLLDYGLESHLFPRVKDLSAPEQEMISIAMTNTDTRLAQDKPVTPAFLVAVLLWGPLQREWKRLQDEEIHPVPAFQQAAQNVINEQNQQISIPKRFQIPMREIWDLQVRLPRRQGKRADQTLEHPRFRAAYDFLLLREQAGESEAGLGDWWTRYQEADETGRRTMISQLDAPTGAPRKPRRGRRRFGPRPAQPQP